MGFKDLHYLDFQNGRETEDGVWYQIKGVRNINRIKLSGVIKKPPPHAKLGPIFSVFFLYCR